MNASVERKPTTIYVIDNDPSVRAALMTQMKLAHFSVETFSSLSEFLRQSAKKENACIVIDLETADLSGFNPRSAAMRLAIPVIVLSTSDSIVNRQRALYLGAVGFFHKPVDPEALLDAVAWAIESARDGHEEEVRYGTAKA